MKKSIFILSAIVMILVFMFVGCVQKPKSYMIQATVYGLDGSAASFAGVKVGDTVMKADASGTVSAKVTSGKVLFSAWEAGSKLESKEMTINSNRAIRLELNQTTDSYGFIYRKTGEALNAIYVIPEALAPKAAVFEGPAGMKPQAVGKGHFLFTQEVGDKTQIDWSPLLEGEASKGLYYAFSIPVEGEISGQARIYQGEGRSIGNLPEAPLTDEERAILPDSVLAAVGDVVAPFGRVDVLDLVDFLNYWKGVYQAKYDLGSIVAMEFARPNGTPPQPFNASTLVKDSAVNVYDLLVMLNGYHLATTEIANFTNINKPFPVTNVNAVLAGAGYNVTWTIQHAGDVQEGFDIYVGNTPGALTTYLGTAAPTALSYAISGTAHTGKYVSVVANNAPYYSETAVGPALPSSGGGVVVTSVNYVDLTTFEINFSGAVDSVGIANVSVSVGVITNVVLDGAKTKATVTVTGLPYGAVVTVNVTNVMAGAFLVPNYTGSFSTPPVTDFYELVLTCNAPDNTIPSDGLSSTQLTATLYDKITGLPVTTLAEIRFSATLGSLSQSSVGLSGSSASTQLRSVSSPTPLISVVRAKLQSSTVMPQIVGLESNPLNVQFTLDGEPVKVRAESAGAPTGDRFWVEFSGAITPQQYKSIVLDPGWSADIPYGVLYIPNSGSPAVRYPMHILDVIQGGNPKRLMFILDSDHFEPRLPMNERSMAPGVSNAEDSWLGFIPSVVPGGGITKQYRLLDYSYTFMQHDPLGPSVGNFLRDNVNHTIVFPEEITDIIEKSNPITFQFSDVTEPVVGGVTPTDNCNLVVMFSEPVCETLAETPKEKDDNPHFTIDGRQLYFVTTPVAADINYAASASKILITDLHVGKYDPITGVDERTKVFIKIYPDDQFKLAPGEHILQIHNVGDWAGWTDVAQNRITTQSYAFRIDADTQLPMVEVTRQSPEQFLIKFNRKVKIEAGRNLNEALIIETPTLPPNAKIVANMVANSMGTTPAIARPEYIVTAVNEDGTAYDLAGTKANLTPGGPLPDEWDTFLVEFIQDWEVVIGDITSGYWNTGSGGKQPYNPLIFRFNFWETNTGLKMVPTDIPVSNPYDGQSPLVIKTEDLYAKMPHLPFRNDANQPASLFHIGIPGDAADGTTLSKITAFENSEPGKYIYVEMDEPVQLISKQIDDPTQNTGRSNPTTPNLKQLPGQIKATAYNETDGLPVLDVTFNNRANPSITTKGSLVPGSVAQDDQSFVVRPNTKLTGGIWDMYIYHMSDDHGNSYETVSIEVNVPPSTVSPKVAWIGFLNDVWVPNDGFSGGEIRDVVHIKFTDTMKAGPSNGVDKTMNYKFRGYELPAGSYILQGIHGLLAGPGLTPGTTIIALVQQLNHAITTGWDGVTVVMPRTAWDGMYGGTNFSCNVTLAGNFESVDGRQLDPASRQVELTHTFDPAISPAFPGSNPAVNNDANSNIAPYNGSYYQAAYVNSIPMNLSLKNSERRFFIGAIALDLYPVPGGNGQVDTLAFLLDRQILDGNLNPNQYVYVNGIRSEAITATNPAAENEIFDSVYKDFTADPQVAMWVMDFPISLSPGQNNDAWVFVELKGDAQFALSEMREAERAYPDREVTSGSGNRLIGRDSIRPLKQKAEPSSPVQSRESPEVPDNEFWVWDEPSFSSWFQELGNPPYNIDTLLLLPSVYATNVEIDESETAFKSFNSPIPGGKNTRGPEAIVQTDENEVHDIGGPYNDHEGWTIQASDVSISGLTFQPTATTGAATLVLLSITKQATDIHIEKNVFDVSQILSVTSGATRVGLLVFDNDGQNHDGVMIDRNMFMVQSALSNPHYGDIALQVLTDSTPTQDNEITNNLFKTSGRGGSDTFRPYGIYVKPATDTANDIHEKLFITSNIFEGLNTKKWQYELVLGRIANGNQTDITVRSNTFGGSATSGIYLDNTNGEITILNGSNSNVFSGVYEQPNLNTGVKIGDKTLTNEVTINNTSVISEAQAETLLE